MGATKTALRLCSYYLWCSPLYRNLASLWLNSVVCVIIEVPGHSKVTDLHSTINHWYLGQGQYFLKFEQFNCWKAHYSTRPLQEAAYYFKNYSRIFGPGLLVLSESVITIMYYILYWFLVSNNYCDCCCIVMSIMISYSFFNHAACKALMGVYICATLQVSASSNRMFLAARSLWTNAFLER
jgi:hypothetical protein